MTLVSTKLNIYSFTAEVQENKINLSATITHNEKDEMIETKPLLDCKAGENRQQLFQKICMGIKIKERMD